MGCYTRKHVGQLSRGIFCGDLLAIGYAAVKEHTLVAGRRRLHNACNVTYPSCAPASGQSHMQRCLLWKSSCAISSDACLSRARLQVFSQVGKTKTKYLQYFLWLSLMELLGLHIQCFSLLSLWELQEKIFWSGSSLDLCNSREATRWTVY